MPRYIGVTDADRVFVAVSDDLAALLGYEPAELVGMPTHEILLDPVGERLEAARRRAADDGGADGVATLRARDGRPIRYRYSMRAVTNHDGSLFVTVGEPIAGETLSGRPVLVTKLEAAAIVRRSVRTIDRAIAAGELPATGRPGQRRLIRLRDLERWLGAALHVLGLLAAVALACSITCDYSSRWASLMRRAHCPLVRPLPRGPSSSSSSTRTRSRRPVGGRSSARASTIAARNASSAAAVTTPTSTSPAASGVTDAGGSAAVAGAAALAGRGRRRRAARRTAPRATSSGGRGPPGGRRAARARRAPAARRR